MQCGKSAWNSAVKSVSDQITPSCRKNMPTNKVKLRVESLDFELDITNVKT